MLRMNLSEYLSQEQLDGIIEAALAEDIGRGDVTTKALLPPNLSGQACLVVKEDGVLAGIYIAKRVFQKVDPSLHFEVLIGDGTAIRHGDIIGTVSGSIAGILKGERVALNFLQRLSGIATTTAQYVVEVRGLKAKVFDTRKTTPGLRSLDKYAVRAGGGENHRLNLGGAVLIKDNHIAALRVAGLGLADIIAKARKNAPAGITIEVEVTSTEEAEEALKAAPDIIMLDNMAPDEMRHVVKMVGGRARMEASGGITLENVRRVAETGVDMISVGALTHSYRSLDISLEMEPPSS